MRKCSSLNSCAMENMQNVDGFLGFSVIDEIFSDGKAQDARGDLIASSTRMGEIAEERKMLLDGIDQPIGNVKTGTSCPIDKDLIQFLLCLF